MQNDEKDIAGWKLLTFVSGDIEADIISGLLEAENIPVIKRYKSIENYLKIVTGMVTGVWVYVPEAMYNKAQQITGITDVK